jgi:OOP family OmpA-OmpF porin
MMTRYLLAATVALLPLPAFAQATPASLEKSSDQIVCELSGDCGQADTAAAEQPRPETRGFSIARRVATAAPAVGSRERLIERPAAKPAEAGKMTTKLATAGRSNAAITFVAGSSEMTADGKRQALQFLQAIKAPQLSGKRFDVNGYTDASGNPVTNRALSQKRAQSVVDFLVSNGANRAQLAAHGYGADKLIDPANPASAANRRVEFVKVN